MVFSRSEGNGLKQRNPSSRRLATKGPEGGLFRDTAFTRGMSNRSQRAAVVDAESDFLQSCAEKWAKGSKRGAKWDKETFEDFPVCVYWCRQMVALAVGIGMGITGATGAGGLVGGFGITMAITHAYYSFFIQADELSFSESGLKMEGTMQAFAVFLLGWIVTFTVMGHGEDAGGSVPPP